MAITFNPEKLQEVLEQYKAHFEEQWTDEKYKWRAVKHFQEHWDMDAADFAGMLAGCKNRHPSPICTRFEHHFHVLKPHLHRRSFSDTLPENQRHLIALKRHPLWHMQKLCQLSQPAELRSTFFRNRNAVLCQDVLQLSNPLALSLEFFLSCVKVFHRLTLHLVVAGPFQF